MPAPRTGPIIKTVDQAMQLRMTALALELQSKPDLAVEGLYSCRYQNGSLFVDPVNGSPFVFSFPCSMFSFEPEKGSGTDKLRQRINAQIYFDNMVAAREASGKPFYLTPACVPKKLQLSDLPIQVGPHTVYQWLENGDATARCHISGPFTPISEKYGSVKKAVEHLDYLFKLPAEIVRTDREQAYIDQSDAMVTQSEARRTLRARP